HGSLALVTRGEPIVFDTTLPRLPERPRTRDDKWARARIAPWALQALLEELHHLIDLICIDGDYQLVMDMSIDTRIESTFLDRRSEGEKPPVMHQEGDLGLRLERIPALVG